MAFQNLIIYCIALHTSTQSLQFYHFKLFFAIYTFAKLNISDDEVHWTFPGYKFVWRLTLIFSPIKYWYGALLTSSEEESFDAVEHNGHGCCTTMSVSDNDYCLKMNAFLHLNLLSFPFFPLSQLSWQKYFCPSGKKKCFASLLL